MKEIRLTQGKITLVDDYTFECLNQWKWHFCRGYAVRYDCSEGYKNKTKIFMHRQILGLTDSKIEGDHKDGDKLNNQSYNLRAASRGQNSSNRRAKKNGASKYLGVYKIIDKRNGKNYTYWASSVRYDKKIKFIGTFKSEEEAALAYNKAALQLHGEFANLNIIEQATHIYGNSDQRNGRRGNGL